MRFCQEMGLDQKKGFQIRPCPYFCNRMAGSGAQFLSFVFDPSSGARAAVVSISAKFLQQKLIWAFCG